MTLLFLFCIILFLHSGEGVIIWLELTESLGNYGFELIFKMESGLSIRWKKFIDDSPFFSILKLRIWGLILINRLLDYDWKELSKPIKRFQIWERFRKRKIMLEIITKKEIHLMKILKKLQTEFDYENQRKR